MPGPGFGALDVIPRKHLRPAELTAMGFRLGDMVLVRDAGGDSWVAETGVLENGFGIFSLQRICLHHVRVGDVRLEWEMQFGNDRRPIVRRIHPVRWNIAVDPPPEANPVSA